MKYIKLKIIEYLLILGFILLGYCILSIQFGFYQAINYIDDFDKIPFF